MASQVGDYHHKFEGGKVVSAVVMPPQAHRELQGKQNKTKQNMQNPSSIRALEPGAAPADSEQHTWASVEERLWASTLTDRDPAASDLL